MSDNNLYIVGDILVYIQYSRGLKDQTNVLYIFHGTTKLYMFVLHFLYLNACQSMLSMLVQSGAIHSFYIHFSVSVFLVPGCL